MTLEEVRDATGFEAVRSADALAVSMYVSRGLTIDGFEVKVSRADWLKELEQPAKSESWLQHCHRWWLVISDTSLVHEGELPPTWGMLTPGKRGKLEVVVRAPELRPAPLTMERLTALMYAQGKKLAADRDQMRDELWAEIRTRNEEQESGWREKCKALQARVDAVEAACGYPIIGSEYTWPRRTPEQIGKAFRMIVEPVRDDWSRVRRSIEQEVSTAERVLAALKASAGAIPDDYALGRPAL